jgi:hypothetical protein
MKVTVIPHTEQLKILVNNNGTRNFETYTSTLPSMYAPWPDAHEKGFVDIEVKGQTLRDLLTELGFRYTQKDVDFDPICPITHDVKLDYKVLINGRDYIYFPHRLEESLNEGDEIKVSAETLGHC